MPLMKYPLVKMIVRKKVVTVIESKMRSILTHHIPVALFVYSPFIFSQDKEHENSLPAYR